MRLEILKIINPIIPTVTPVTKPTVMISNNVGLVERYLVKKLFSFTRKARVKIDKTAAGIAKMNRFLVALDTEVIMFLYSFR